MHLNNIKIAPTWNLALLFLLPFYCTARYDRFVAKVTRGCLERPLVPKCQMSISTFPKVTYLMLLAANNP